MDLFAWSTTGGLNGNSPGDAGKFLTGDVDLSGKEAGYGPKLSQWADLESAGAVFLSAAGYRDMTPLIYYSSSIQAVNTQCHYWTATHYDDDAYCVFSSYEGSGSFNYASYDYRFSGCSVRLAGVK